VPTDNLVTPRVVVTVDHHKRVNSTGSILSILSCSSKEFSEGDYTTDFLVEDAKKIITQNEGLLREASKNRYRLGELLLGMLDHAPDPYGQRYVAIVLHIANGKGIEAVIDAAKAWFDYLFFPSQSHAFYVISANFWVSVDFI